MIDMRYHELPDWTETVRNEPILSGTDIDNIKDTRFRVLDNINATKLIMSHHIVACEEFYVQDTRYKIQNVYFVRGHRPKIHINYYTINE